MGYTRYWSRTNKPITKEFVKKAKEIVKDCESKGIKLCDSDGQGTPYIDNDLVALNGNGEYELDHESFVIDNKHFGFDFCKTAQKPYDYAVREILKVAERENLITDVGDDGEYNEIISDKEYLGES